MARRQILCISGGGYAGLFAAALLARLEAQLPPLSKIGDRFDAFAGTSIGGLIALALANGKPAREILALMLRAGPKVFLKKSGGLARMTWGPKHAVAPLRRHAEELLSGKTLGTLQRPIVIPAVSLSSGQPKLFRAFPGRPDADSGVSLLDVALATSAAPLYFPPHKIGQDLFADGGLIANVPDALAILDAIEHYGWPKDDLAVLSIGTTYVPPGALTHSTKGWGLLKWMIRDRKLLAIAMHAQMQLAQSTATRLISAQRLLRIDPPLSPAQADAIGLDVASSEASATLQGLAQAAMDAIDPQQRKLFLAHSARPA